MNPEYYRKFIAWVDGIGGYLDFGIMIAIILIILGIIFVGLFGYLLIFWEITWHSIKESDKVENKSYLGDSIYINTDGFGIILTTENGVPIDPSNEIYLEQSALKGLVDYARRYKLLE
jgi:hypothetical protein